MKLVSLPAPTPEAASTLLAGTVLRARSGFYTVRTDAGRDLECRLRGRVKQERGDSDLVVIGDRVAVEPLADGEGMIESVEPRRTRFSRRQPGPRGTWKEDMIVANLDQVAVVFACADPMPHLRMVDRFLVVAEHNEVDALVVANKVDLVGVAAARALFEGYQAVGYPVHYVSAREGIGVEELADRLVGRVSVVTGPSGVGKSTLLNAIQPGLRIETGDVSAAVHKGRHTTTSAELHPLTAPGGGYVADTPGLRELGLWQIPDADLAWCFPEMRPHLGGCGFNDCRHLGEPRCAVRAAVAAGSVSEVRYDSFRRLLVNED
ncbi:MAG TPA: ribosome small subunit-dependent GTPase A [Candidatus Limnocylindria bacterium]|nr:ribosome small subunit-dependent GTPase A [Candidatus Limnocylindria bacterium]